MLILPAEVSFVGAWALSQGLSFSAGALATAERGWLNAGPRRRGRSKCLNKKSLWEGVAIGVGWAAGRGPPRSIRIAANGLSMQPPSKCSPQTSPRQMAHPFWPQTQVKAREDSR